MFDKNPPITGYVKKPALEGFVTSYGYRMKLTAVHAEVSLELEIFLLCGNSICLVGVLGVHCVIDSLLFEHAFGCDSQLPQQVWHDINACYQLQFVIDVTLFSCFEMWLALKATLFC